MTTSGKHTPSQIFVQFGAGILSNVSFSKTGEENIFNACDIFSSVSTVFLFPNSSLLMPFFTLIMYLHISKKFIISFTFLCNIYFILFSLFRVSNVSITLLFITVSHILQCFPHVTPSVV